MAGELDPRVVQALRSKEEIVNYVRHVIDEVRTVLRIRPDPRLPINTLMYRIWERRYMIRWGMAAQAVVDAHIFEFLSLEEMLQLQKELRALLLHTHADAQMGKPL